MVVEVDTRLDTGLSEANAKGVEAEILGIGAPLTEALTVALTGAPTAAPGEAYRGSASDKRQHLILTVVITGNTCFAPVSVTTQISDTECRNPSFKVRILTILESQHS